MEQFHWDNIGPIAKRTFYGTLPSASLAGKLAAGAFVALGAAFGQNYIIYPAYAPAGSRTDVPTPDKHGMPHYEDLTLETPDKLKIKAYLMLRGNTEEASKRPTILFLHANAGNMGHRLPFARIFYERFQCNVFMLSYRGYGLSEGQANEKGIRQDAQLALDYIRSHPALEKTRVVLYGQSIGGAVSLDLASNNSKRIDGIILENTFLSLSRMAIASMPISTPYIMLGLLKDKWNSVEAIRKVPSSLPMLFLAGDLDEIVPPKQFKALYAICPSEKKEWTSFPYGTHNDTCVAPEYWPRILEWLGKEIGEMPPNALSKAKKTAGGGNVAQQEHLEETMGAGSLAP